LIIVPAKANPAKPQAHLDAPRNINFYLSLS
jgi:hypothetical protein